MASLQTILISCIISFFLGGLGGWKISSGKTEAARAELASVRLAADLAKQYFEKESAKLKQETLEIQAKAKLELDIAQSNLDSFQKQNAVNIARKNTEIQNLKSLVSAGEKDLLTLKENLVSATSDAEKARLLAEIVKKEKEVLESRLRGQGLECLSVPIPEEFLLNLNKV